MSSLNDLKRLLEDRSCKSIYCSERSTLCSVYQYNLNDLSALIIIFAWLTMQIGVATTNDCFNK